MRVAEAQDVKELAAWSEPWCVSAFVPGHEPEGRQDGDLLRLRNMLRDAERELVTLGMRQKEAAGLLESALPAELTDRTSVEFHRGGIGLFVSPGLHRVYRIPFDMPELATVGRRFHLKPALGALVRDRRFFVLTLTKGRARVYLGELNGLGPVEIPGMPDGFEDVTQYDEVSDSPRWDELNRADHLPEDVLRYVRSVDDAVTSAIPGDPLVIGGTAALVSSYVRMTGYRAIVTPSLPANPDAMSTEQLHDAALEALGASVSTELERDEARFHELNGTGRASAQLAVVLKAAHLGRIETVFVASDRQSWGVPGTSTAAVAQHERRMPGDEDLLDLAAVGAWQSSAAVHVVPGDEVPGDGPIAAIFRY